ncbi:aminotransferase class I/II-fold pyridoxal phosphate-dependent enzyme [Patescibacteria group bacterium]|nr:aminotransferase class I/II-fold pyridoxal phosphate-dependent enzyme [Patescibacteria group bacterium]MBU4162205.1 aminotransferase class I/II-fold pyridoxal phosphate-dependent enzyme [Patescibacteria group bacterium]
MPWKWKKGREIKKLEEKFRNYLAVNNAFSFNSGRSAFMAILKSLELEKGSEILVQAFTCNAAVNPIIWSGLKPAFVDIQKESLNIDPADLERKITSNSKAVLVQHTFGFPAKIDKILEICEKHNLILIEDCAHSLGAEYRNRKVGTFGKAAFFSFGRDKVISSIYGGMAISNDPVLAEKIKNIQGDYQYPCFYWVFQQLLHPILIKVLVMPFYNFFGLGKIFLITLQKLKIISKAVTKSEKQGIMPKYFPKRMPNALAVLGLKQLNKIDEFNKHREKISEIYRQGLSQSSFDFLELKDNERKNIYMRFPILCKKNESDNILEYFKKQNIFLDDGWRKSAIVPIGTNIDKMNYIKGSCPVAEDVSQRIINLPTHINISPNTAEKIKKLLLDF